MKKTKSSIPLLQSTGSRQREKKIFIFLFYVSVFPLDNTHPFSLLCKDRVLAIPDILFGKMRPDGAGSAHTVDGS